MRERAPRLDFNLHPQQIPSPLSNSHTERDWTHLFSVQPFTWFAIFNVLWISCWGNIHNSYICLLEYNLKNSEDFYTMYKKCYFKWLSFGLHVSAHTRRRRLTLVAFLAPAFEARRMHRWVGATLPQHTLPYLVAAPPPLDDWRPTSDIIDWQVVREESIELDWSLRM